jgi:hypothetical protein
MSITQLLAEEVQAHYFIKKLLNDEHEAKDMLRTNKVSQAFHANKSCGPEEVFNVGNKVMLATLHCWCEYKAGDKNCVAKFFLQFDGPHFITHAFPNPSVYTLDLPNSPNMFPTFHASLLKQFENDCNLFPGREHPMPGPVVTVDGMEEYTIEKIVNGHRKGCGTQYLVHWISYLSNHDQWMPR